MNTSFEYKTELDGVRVRYARGRSIRVGNEIHPYHEILFFLQGGGRLLTEDFEVTLDSPTLCIFPKNAYHRFTVENQDEYTRIAISIDTSATRGADLSRGGPRVISPLTPTLELLLSRIRDAVASPERDSSRLMLEGAVLMLLAELYETDGERQSPERRAVSPELERAIAYIEKNLSVRISTSDVARAAGLSDTALSRLFRESLGITVYRFVTEKRLALAHELISGGELPTKIYTEVGFGDYATFYKAYRKAFGRPPSEG